MLAFVIPFKPMRNSKNWSQDSYYLRQTIKSMLAQTERCFCIYVIMHEMPLDPEINSKVKYLKFPMPYVEYLRILDLDDYLHSNSYLRERDIEYLFDQGRKQIFGAQKAISDGANYIMSVDADDLIHKDLVKYIYNNLYDGPGWYVNKGYLSIANSGIYIRQPSSMNLINGSTYIINKKYIPPFIKSGLKLSQYDFFANHLILQHRILCKYGYSLKSLPFYATIVQITEQNWWMNKSNIKGNSIKQKIKYFVRKVYFKKFIYQNFGVK
jgi:hypothetical protein